MRTILIVLLLSACTVEGHIDPKQPNRLVECTDTRETTPFRYNTSQITEVRYGFGTPSTITLVDLDGRKRTILESEGAYFTCTEIKA